MVRGIMATEAALALAEWPRCERRREMRGRVGWRQPADDQLPYPRRIVHASQDDRLLKALAKGNQTSVF
jgi:hypothetical protein